MTEPKQYLNSVNLNTYTDFPYLVLNVMNDQAYPRNPGFQVMHWHKDLQFIYVLTGNIEVQTLETTVPIHAGEGIFINENVVHHVRRRGNCHYNSFIFPAYFLEFYIDSPAKSFVERITTNEQLPLFLFSGTIPWQQDILSLLQQLVAIEDNKTEFYPYEILTRLSALWLILQKNIAFPAKQKENATNIRMQKMLRFIADHYGEDISLSALAASANISKSECARCFKSSLDATPYQYLTEFRLSKAAHLLQKTEQSIGDIAMACGFHQTSHFGKYFKKKTGCSPREYRRIKK